MTDFPVIDDNTFSIIKQIGPNVFLAIDEDGNSFALKYTTNTNFFNSLNSITKNKPIFLPYIGYNSYPHRFKDKPLIVTKYMLNGTLADIYKSTQKPVNWDATAKSKIAYGVAKTLHYVFLNSSGDKININLTPECIFLDHKLEPKIDIHSLVSSSKIEDRIKKSKSNLKYIAPELLKPDAKFQQWASSYSFAVLLVSLIVDGTPEFDSAEKIKGYKEAKSFVEHENRFKIPPGQPEELIQLIHACWNTNPYARKTFQEIVKSFKTSQVWFKDTDKNQMTAYMNELDKMLPAPAPSTAASPSTKGKPKPSTFKKKNTLLGGRH